MNDSTGPWIACSDTTAVVRCAILHGPGQLHAADRPAGDGAGKVGFPCLCCWVTRSRKDGHFLARSCNVNSVLIFESGSS